ncbi:MAG: NAD(P)/FAD-dependent oxidoreductase [bacterium]
MKVVIIGNGPAGITAAKTIHELNPEVGIEVYSQEGHPYYFRPKLPDLLGGSVEPEEIYAYSEEWYHRRNIGVHLRVTVTQILPARKEIVLEGGARVSYDSLLLAAGSRCLVPPIRGVDKEGVFTLRTIEDAAEIKRYAKGCKRAIVIGGGLLGLEASRGLRSLGLEVTVVEFLHRLLPRQLDEEGASLLRTKIEEMEIQVLLSAESEEILGEGIVTGLLLKDGRKIEGDLILISAGIRANVEIAREAGIAVGKGVLVDEHMRTGVEEVYAAGDVAEFQGRMYGIIPAAIDQAKVAGANMAGNESVEYEGTVPYTTLKVVGVDLTSIGVATPEGEEFKQIRKINPREGVYKKLVLCEGTIVGAIFLGDRRDVTPVNKLITGKIDVSKHAGHLLDEDFDMRTLIS